MTQYNEPTCLTQPSLVFERLDRREPQPTSAMPNFQVNRGKGNIIDPVLRRSSRMCSDAANCRSAEFSARVCLREAPDPRRRMSLRGLADGTPSPFTT